MVVVIFVLIIRRLLLVLFRQHFLGELTYSASKMVAIIFVVLIRRLLPPSFSLLAPAACKGELTHASTKTKGRRIPPVS